MKYFNGKEHLRRYKETLSRMKKNDCYHRSLAYLLTANDDTYRHINALFDFDEDGIIPSGVGEGWQTGHSIAVTRMAFNLWNGMHADADGDHPASYTPYNLFCYTSLAANFYIAALIRYEEIDEAMLAEDET